MIIDRSSTPEAVSFFERGLRATRGVVRVSSPLGSVTGWLVTPRLILTSAFVVDLQKDTLSDSLVASWLPGGEAAPARVRVGLLWSGYSVNSELHVVLLEILETHPGVPLELNLRPIWPPCTIFVLQHPQGYPLRLSTGSVLEATQEGAFFYDASTSPGSGGAPVFDDNWNVVGMHERSSAPPMSSLEGKRNRGLSLPRIIEGLRQAPQWHEIASHHRLLTHLKSPSHSAPVSEGDHRTRVYRAAAVRWSFNPDTLDPAARRLLATDVADTEAPRWSLRSEARMRALRAAASLKALREARGLEPAESPEQQVIDRILQGPPFRLAELSEAELPIWIPAVRWFAGIVPELPSAAEVVAALDLRRHRGRLERVVGPHFAGRTQELDQLAQWLTAGPGPFVVSGPGGVGKSALIARFILDSATPFVWIDFDSADIAPDDAPTLLAEVARQLMLQFPALRQEPLESESWQEGVGALGRALAQQGIKNLLLILDSFEAAQYEGRHAELWPFVEALWEQVPSLRVLVSGRVPLPNLSLRGRAARRMHLPALDDESARAWLTEEGLQEPLTVETILSVTRRIPLNLVLATELVKSGDSLMDLSRALPQRLIQGYLYRRILRRISTESLRRLARGALVLRRLTSEMVYPVLGKACGIEEKDAQACFTKLAGELALVEGTTVLRHRPDVRNAVLSLLEAEDAEWVKSIEREAISWYATQDTQEPDIATELVYHRLRLGDLPGAEKAWVQGVASRLGSFALEEVPEPGRSWLSPRLKASPAEVPLEDWEREASQRVRDAVERKLWRAVPGILGERSERSRNSPLLFLEAYALWKQGNSSGARSVLASEGHGTGTAARNRAVLQACLAEEARELEEADRWLEPLCERTHWKYRPMADLEWMAVVAARVRLTVDLELEKHFAKLCSLHPEATRLVSEADLVLPHIQELLNWPETSFRLEVGLYLRPASPPEPLQESLHRYIASGPAECRRLAQLVGAELEVPRGLKPALDPDRLVKEGHFDPSPALAPALELVWKSTLRWRLALKYPLLQAIYALAQAQRQNEAPLISAILAQAAAFSSPHLTITGPSGPLHKLIASWMSSIGVSREKKSEVLWLLSKLPQGAQRPEKSGLSFEDYLIWNFRQARRPQWILTALYLLAPSPLPLLVERLAENPT